MKLKMFQIDAFTSKRFEGNPAAVVVMDADIDESVMQSIAAENNLSETAFVNISSEPFHIRWFAPSAEVDLCGHATLASAKALFDNYFQEKNEIVFTCKEHGKLLAKRDDDLIYLDFPTDNPAKNEQLEEIRDAIGVMPDAAYQGKTKLMAVLSGEQKVKDLEPNFEKISRFDQMGLIVTARSAEFDFVSRCFFPKTGVDEDPVTGSAHAVMIPYWASQLGKNKMVAKQISERSGILYCELADDRVILGGYATTFFYGEIII